MYNNVKSRVKFMNELSDSFHCNLGVKQGECLSPFLFAMFLNDIEDVFVQHNVDGIELHMFKMFLILYADDIAIKLMKGKALRKHSCTRKQQPRFY